MGDFAGRLPGFARPVVSWKRCATNHGISVDLGFPANPHRDGGLESKRD
jgi:hypothetical protein